MNDIRNDNINDIMNDIKNDIRNDNINDIRNDTRIDIRNDNRNDIRNDNINDNINDIRIDIRNDFKNDITVCVRQCGGGRCVRPNLCMCNGGDLSPACPSGSRGRGNGIGVGTGVGTGTGIGGGSGIGAGGGRPGGFYTNGNGGLVWYFNISYFGPYLYQHGSKLWEYDFSGCIQTEDFCNYFINDLKKKNIPFCFTSRTLISSEQSRFDGGRGRYDGRDGGRRPDGSPIGKIGNGFQEGDGIDSRYDGDGNGAFGPGGRRDGDGAYGPGGRRDGDGAYGPGGRRDGDGAFGPGGRRDGDGAFGPGGRRDGDGAFGPGGRRDGVGDGTGRDRGRDRDDRGRDRDRGNGGTQDGQIYGSGQNGVVYGPGGQVIEGGVPGEQFPGRGQFQGGPGGFGPGGAAAGCTVHCLNGGTCIGNQCRCRKGFTGENCAEPVCLEPCLNGGRCVGPDRCACIYGFTGRRCEADYRTGPCFSKVEHDMCQGQLPGVVCTKHLCCATIGKAWGHPCEYCPERLDCQPGYLKNIHSGKCLDIDECEAIPGLCVGGKCVNSVGSFSCECPEGQARNPETNACEDRDECKEEDICRDGRCVNTDGAFYCICNRGFIQSPDRKSCIEEYRQLCEEPQGGIVLPPVDECILNPSICGEGACVDTDDGYECSCYPGFSNTALDQRCKDINECQLGMCRGGYCTNTRGSFHCRCPQGFDLSSDGQTCIDIDECAENARICLAGRCENLDGSYRCACDDGYTHVTDGSFCTDKDECAETGMCDHGQCINMDGSFKCVCQPGYTLSPSGKTCVDTKLDYCYAVYRDGQCSNPSTTPTTKSACCCCSVILGQPMGWGIPCQACPQPGSKEFSHLCPHGPGITHEGDDINECAQNPAICRNGACENLKGSYRCICNKGYSVDESGRICEDINDAEILLVAFNVSALPVHN
ncbi:Fibrillin-2 [Armadillidium vulgare]|nr:Fibrillin-2 [Armadillidium vulgare]